MPRITKQSFSAGATVPTGQFANLRFDVSEEQELLDGDDPVACYAELRNRVCARLTAEISAISNRART